MKNQVPTNQIHRLLSAGPVLLVTSVLRGRVALTTVSWFTPLSADPPIVGIAIRPNAFIHDILKRSEEFTLNVAHAEYVREVHHCGIVSSEDHDKLAETRLHTSTARQIEAPWIDECIAHIECGLIGTQEWGDHTLFVGQILGAWAEEDAFNEGWQPQNEAGHILHHLGGKRYTVADKVIDATSARPEKES